MKISGPSFLSRQHGSVVRVLVLVLCCASLVWMGWLLLLPKELQESETRQFVALSIAAWLLVFFIWRALKKPEKEITRVFWLSQDGASEPCGPYTVAQIVAMWKAGQITTNGAVMQEGEDRWLPIMAFAHEFDSSLEKNEKSPSFGLGRAFVIALLLLILIALLFGPHR